jgi:hypothetical protein
MSTRDLGAKSVSKGMGIVVVDAGSKSSADGDKVEVDTSRLQEVSYVDAVYDTKGEDVCHIPEPPEQFVTQIPTKVDPKTLTYMSKTPAIDIDFQDLTYSVRNPGRRTGKLQLSLFYRNLLGLYSERYA